MVWEKILGGGAEESPRGFFRGRPLSKVSNMPGVRNELEVRAGRGEKGGEVKAGSGGEGGWIGIHSGDTVQGEFGSCKANCWPGSHVTAPSLPRPPPGPRHSLEPQGSQSTWEGGFQETRADLRQGLG